MAKEKALRPWQAPELKRLGELKDVAGPQTPNSQASNVKS